MSNEIKVGDKVRVREDAPKLYAKGWLHDWCNTDSIVKEMDNEDAVISPITRANDELAIPCKYLVKVDAEAKERKFKVGDFAYCNLVKVKIAEIRDNGDIVAHTYDGYRVVGRECDFEPYTEPTEQTEAEKNDSDNLKKVAEEWANTVSSSIREYGDAACKIIIDAHTKAYWDAYTADLAKEVALKVANKYNDPKEAAEYAVNVAEVVVEGLKKK